MSLIGLVVTLLVIGLLLWAVNAIFPLDPTIRKIINVVVIVGVCLWLTIVIRPSGRHRPRSVEVIGAGGENRTRNRSLVQRSWIISPPLYR